MNQLRFTKADPAIDSHFTAESDRVLVKPHEITSVIAPIYPEDDGFWDQFEIVLERVTDAKTRSPANHVADCFRRAGMVTADRSAKAVHKDWVSDLMQIAAKDALAKGGVFRDLGLESSFTDKVVLLDSLIGMAGFMVSASSFCLKDQVRMPRPEEVAGAIVRGEIKAPRRIELALRTHPDFKKLAEDQRLFTMFPEGCPLHGAFSAMHSGAASAEGVVIKVMLSGADDIIDHCTMNVGGFRMEAGVHYPQDNVAGYVLGQKAAAKWIPEYLVALGAEPTKVAQALKAALATDWLYGTQSGRR